MKILTTEVGSIFPTTVWAFQSDGVLDVATKKCLDIARENEGRKLSNRGGFQSDLIEIGNVPEFSEIFDFFNQCLREVETFATQEYKCPINLRMQRNGGWINVNGKGDFNIPHVHPNTAFAFVYYLQVDDPKSTLAFHRPDLSNHYPFDNFGTDFYGKRAHCKVSPGLGVMFPAWMMHEVYENTSEIPRVSIAINVEQC
jgi:uncharacterized protein (TIGR02466 family)